MADEFQDAAAPRDLLGDPIDQNRENWGRPAFEKTKEKQEVVAVLKAAGWSNERIARYIGCDVKTLRKHFSLELSQATDAAEAEALLTIHRRMKEGNVSAARQVMSLAEKGRAAPPMPTPAGPDPDEAAEGEADPLAGLGKKERQAELARKPGGKWANILARKVH